MRSTCTSASSSTRSTPRMDGGLNAKSLMRKVVLAVPDSTSPPKAGQSGRRDGSRPGHRGGSQRSSCHGDRCEWEPVRTCVRFVRDPRTFCRDLVRALRRSRLRRPLQLRGDLRARPRSESRGRRAEQAGGRAQARQAREERVVAGVMARRAVGGCGIGGTVGWFACSVQATRATGGGGRLHDG